VGVIIGFVAGYVFGTRAGAEGYEEMISALRTITSSGELRELAGGVVSILGDVLKQGSGVIGEGAGAKLRRIA
jgi:hypothetical protein